MIFILLKFLCVQFCFYFKALFNVLKDVTEIKFIIIMLGYLNKGISAREICNFASLVLALQRKMWRTTEYLSKTLTPQASSSSLCVGENMAVGAEKKPKKPFQHVSDKLTSDKGDRRSTFTNTAVIPAVCLIFSDRKQK